MCVTGCGGNEPWPLQEGKREEMMLMSFSVDGKETMSVDMGLRDPSTSVKQEANATQTVSPPTMTPTARITHSPAVINPTLGPDTIAPTFSPTSAPMFVTLSPATLTTGPTTVSTGTPIMASTYAPTTSPGATSVSVVSSSIAFSSLDISSFSNDTWAAAFNSSFKDQMASSAGVSSEVVTITGVAASSVTLSSSVEIPASNSGAASQFEATLTTNVDSIFSGSDLSSLMTPSLSLRTRKTGSASGFIIMSEVLSAVPVHRASVSLALIISRMYMFLTSMCFDLELFT
eukprot:gene10347-biopygen10578